MTLKSVSIENNYGKGTQLIQVFANYYTHDDAVEMEGQKFQIKENINTKELMQFKVEGQIDEKTQPSYIQRMINHLHKEHGIWFSYDPSFVISWRDKVTKEKRIFSKDKK